MKHVVKGRQPDKFMAWCARNRNSEFLKFCYEELEAEAKATLHTALLAEQGHLCAYTMRPIDCESSHIEHIKPRKVSQAEQTNEDLDYHNMVACFPVNGGDTSHGFGAPVKADWWEPKLFVSPLAPNCEHRFRFEKNGQVAPALPDDAAASETIKVLGLDCNGLRVLRRSAIETAIYGKKGKPRMRSEAQTELLIEQATVRLGNGRFREYCVAVKQAAQAHLETLRKLRKRRAYSRPQE